MVNKNFLRQAQRTYQKETLHLISPSRRDASGSWLITPGVKNPKHVFVFFEQTQRRNALTQNHIFETFHLDGGDAAKLFTCRLQYRSKYYPKVDYASDFKTRILSNLTNFRYRKNDYNSGVQLQIGNFTSLYSIIDLDLRAAEGLAGDPQSLTPTTGFTKWPTPRIIPFMRPFWINEWSKNVENIQESQAVHDRNFTTYHWTKTKRLCAALCNFKFIIKQFERSTHSGMFFNTQKQISCLCVAM